MGFGGEWAFGANFSMERPDATEFDIDLDSMVFMLDKGLEPRGFHEETRLMPVRAEVSPGLSPKNWGAQAQAQSQAEAQAKTQAHAKAKVQARAKAQTQDQGPGVEQDESQGQKHVQVQLQFQAAAEAQAQAKGQLGSVGTLPQPRTLLSDSNSDITGHSFMENESLSSQSPKIVISNSQFEHLKQKMQTLKQQVNDGDRQSPFDVSVSRLEKEFNSNEGLPLTCRVKSSIRNCPGQHGLLAFPTPDADWWCSICDKDHTKGTMFYGCRSCDYDVCESCYLQDSEVHVSSQPSQPTSISAEDAALREQFELRIRESLPTGPPRKPKESKETRSSGREKRSRKEDCRLYPEKRQKFSKKQSRDAAHSDHRISEAIAPRTAPRTIPRTAPRQIKTLDEDHKESWVIYVFSDFENGLVPIEQVDQRRRQQDMMRQRGKLL